WNFKTANVPVTITGDYRSAATGNWGTGSVATTIWEMFDGTSWIPTAALPSGSTPTVTIRSGHTVKLNATTSVGNVVIESGAALISGTSTGAAGTATQRNLRVAGSVNNFGTVGSSSTSTDRINFEAAKSNGTIYITGTNTYYLNTFSVHGMAQNLEVVIDANLNLSSFLRAFSTTSPSDNSQNDDNVTVTINEGKTVSMGSNGYLHIQSSGSTNITNTISSFGNYTYNINGTLDMRSTGTTCIVAHSTLPSTITINTNGAWLLGNAARLISAATTVPTGVMTMNIGTNGVVDAGARTLTGNTATNLVMANITNGQTAFFNITGGGLLKNRVTSTEFTFAVGSNNTYSPVKLFNSGTADIFAVGVATGFDKPVGDMSRMVNKQYTIVPATPGTANVDISLGWMPADHGANFVPAGGVVQGRYNTSSWIEQSANISGAGTIANPYYAKVSGYTSFGTFAVGNATATVLPLNIISMTAVRKSNGNLVTWTTSSESDLDKFEIQRSNDGISFTTTSTAAARNTSSLNMYSFTDIAPLNGVTYYRLKIVNKNNSYSFSKIVKLNSNSFTILSVLPNPASSYIRISHNEIKDRKVLLRIFSASGVLVKQVNPALNTPQTLMDVNDLSSGMYYIELKSGTGKQSISFIKH
ncbi:MAG TPA: T9SS type A sorting domain-containing protein, partial [Flavisolibacter sp.]